MPIQNKPYDPSQGLIRTIFKDHPNLYAMQDIDRNLDLQSAINDYTAQMIGGTWTVANPMQVTASYDTNGVLTWSVFASGAGYSYRGALFSLDMEDNGTTVAGYPVLRFYLIAQKVHDDFTTNPTLCGLVTSVFPDPVAGAEIERWGNVGVVSALNGTAPTVPQGYTLLGCIALIAPESALANNDTSTTVSAVLYLDNTPSSVMAHVTSEMPKETIYLPSLWGSLGLIVRWVKKIRIDLRLLLQAKINTLTVTLDSSVTTLSQAIIANHNELLVRIATVTQNIANLTVATSHDRRVLNFFANLSQAPIILPITFNDYETNPLFDFTVPNGPNRTYIITWTISYRRITTEAFLDALIYRKDPAQTSWIPEGRQFELHSLKVNSEANTMTVVGMVENCIQGTRITGSLANRPGNQNQYTIERSYAVIDGLPTQ